MARPMRRARFRAVLPFVPAPRELGISNLSGRACRLTPIRPPVVNRQGRPVTPPSGWRWCQARRSSTAPTSFPLPGSRPSSLHQTPIGDLVRSAVPAPCPRNSSVPSLVHSKKLARCPVRSGLEKGAELVEGRSSAPRECAEGRWGSNQGGWLPGVIHEATKGPLFWLAPCGSS